LYRFAYAVLASQELVAVADAINFTYDDGITKLNWDVGNSVNPLIWIALFLILATIINMAPVKVYTAFSPKQLHIILLLLTCWIKWFGEIEYVLGSLKLIFITMLILMMVILATMNRTYLEMESPSCRGTLIRRPE
jgi:amino acid transporter